MSKVKFKIVSTTFRIIGAIPLSVLYCVLSPLIYFVLYRVLHYRKSVVESNLKLVFPEKSEQERKVIRKKYYRHLSQLFVEVLACAGISAKNINKRIKFKNTEMMESLYAEGKNVVIVGSHYANWEWGFVYPLHTKLKALIVYKKMDDVLFDEVFKQVRARFGALPVEMNNTVRMALTHSKQQPICLYLIADQSPAGNENTFHYMDFLGVSGTPVFMGPEKIARSMNSAFVYAKYTKVKCGHYEVDFVLLEKNAKETEQNSLTRKYLDALEVEIKENPEYWLWSHRRWKRRKIEV